MRSPEVRASSPVACAAVIWRLNGMLFVTVVVKATFALVPDQDATLVEPVPLDREDRYEEDDPARSLRRGSDLAPYLAGAGVVLVGHAYAPGGQPVAGLSARLALYDGEEALVDKTVHVYGDAPPGGAPAPFVKMPLVYERAYGGPSVPSNPVGVGPSDTRRPNLVHPTNPHRPAGFGPIAPHWPARRRLEPGLPLRAGADEILKLPPALDFRAFNAAPVDQQITPLSGAEWIVLDNLGAAAPRLRTRLPSARARARWHLANPSTAPGAEQEVDLDADTLAIDTDLQTVSVVWRGNFAVDSPELLDKVRVSAGLELPGKPIAWPAPAPARQAPASLSGTATAMMSPFAQPALPFQERDAPRAALAESPAARIAAGDLPDDPLNHTGPTVPVKIAAPALPFAVPGAPRGVVPVTRPAAPQEHTLVHVSRAGVVAMLAGGAGFDGADLSGADLSALDFSGRSLRGCQLRGAVLKGAKLLGAQLHDADLTGAQLDGAELGDAVLEGAKLGGASLVGAVLDGAKLARAQGEGANFDGASLRRADLRNTSFPRASFVGAVLREAQADQGDFTGARFVRADLGAASFRKARLPGAVLAHATLDGTDFRNADLERANVHGTSRRTAKMAGARTGDLDESPPGDPSV